MVLVWSLVHIGDHVSIQDKTKFILVKKDASVVHRFKRGSYVYATSLNLQAIFKIIQSLINFYSVDTYSIIILAWDARELKFAQVWLT